MRIFTKSGRVAKTENLRIPKILRDVIPIEIKFDKRRTNEEKLIDDMLLFGMCFMDESGKRVNPSRVLIK